MAHLAFGPTCGWQTLPLPPHPPSLCHHFVHLFHCLQHLLPTHTREHLHDIQLVESRYIPPPGGWFGTASLTDVTNLMTSCISGASQVVMQFMASFIKTVRALPILRPCAFSWAREKFVQITRFLHFPCQPRPTSSTILFFWM